jgi:tetratricopeptide (TPR) repeat protein
MLTKKKKLSKKEIKEDKLVAFYYKTYAYFDENRARIFLYAGAFVVLVLAVFYYYRTKAEDNITAGVELSRAIDSYDEGAYLEAIEGNAAKNTAGLQKVVDNYGSTENGETAKIYLANSYSMLGKEDDAFKYYKEYDGDIPMFKAAALAGQAGYYASHNEYDKAANTYEKASNVSKVNVLNSDYMLRAGINYIKVGNIAEAKKLFDTIKKDYPGTQAYTEVNKYLPEVQNG